QILHPKRISGVSVVAADGSVVGIVSEGDLMGHALAVGEQRGSWWVTFFSDNSALARDYTKTHGRIARDVMTRAVISIAPTASVAETARILERNRIKRASFLLRRATMLRARSGASILDC